MRKMKVFNPSGLRNPLFCVVNEGGELARELEGTDLDFELELEGKVIGHGKAVGSWGGPIQALPAHLVENHHDPACRTFSGLCLVMSIVMQKQVDGLQEVSAILFEVREPSKLIRAMSIPEGV